MSSPVVSAIRVTAFVTRYKKHVAVQGVDLEIKQGEIAGSSVRTAQAR